MEKSKTIVSVPPMTLSNWVNKIHPFRLDSASCSHGKDPLSLSLNVA